MIYKNSLTYKLISVLLVLLHLFVFCLRDAAFVFAETTDSTTDSAITSKIDSTEDTSKTTDAPAANTEPVNSEESNSQSQNDTKANQAEQSAQALSGGESQSQNNSSSLNFNTLQNVQPSLFSGALTYSIPISVPEGRKGIQPNITLIYSSQSGNGILGMGWLLDLGSIERSTKKGAPKYDSSDTFIFKSGGSTVELVNIGGNEYRAKTEEAFMKFTFDGYSWIVKDKSGITYYFGQTQSSQELSGSNIFKWCLDKVKDTLGNYMTLTYIKDNNQIYPATIQYTGFEPTGLQPAFEVEFGYIDNRYDYFFSYRSNFLIKTTKLLSTISVKQNGSRIRKYTLSYQQSPSTKRSLLSTITQYGLDDSASLPPITFTYQQKPFSFSGVTSWNNIHNFGNNDWVGTRSTSVPYTYIDIFDINRDGLPDRIFRGYNSTDYTKLWVQLNNGSSFDNLIAWSNIAAQPGQNDRASIRYAYAHCYMNTFDINGDALPDRIHVNENDYTKWEVELNNGRGFDSSIVWTNIGGSNWHPEYTRIWGFNYDPPVWGTKDLFDINGDGLPDRIIKYTPSDRWYVQLNNGNNSFDNFTEWLNVQYDSHISESYIRIGSDSVYFSTFDINGDGLPDHLMNHDNGDWEVQFNNGKGFENLQMWEPVIGINGSWQLFWKGDPMYVSTIDINGDGLPDRVMRNYNETLGPWMIQLNNGHGFEPIEEWGPIVHNNDSNRAHISAGHNPVYVDFFDINGDGLPDRVMRGYSSYDHWDVQLNQGPMPDLLSNISNGIGGQTAVTYNSHIGHDNTELTDKGNLGFPVQVVTNISASDGRGNSYSTQYSYDKAKFDYQEREFCGFGKVKVTDVDGNYSLSYFHQDNYKKGRPYKQETYNSSGNLYSKAENIWSEQEPYSGFPAAKFVFLSESNNYTYEGDSSARRTKSQYLYGESPQYGNPTQIIEYGEVNADDGTDIGNDKRIAYPEYTYNTADWIIALPSASQTYDINNNKVSEKKFYYDNHSGIYDAPVQGLLTKEEVWCYNPLTLNEVWLSSQYSYDNYGSLVSSTDANNHTTTTIYDSAYHIYPLTVTNALGHTAISEYYGINGVPLNDGGGFKGLFGQIKSTQDPNQVKSYNTYDDLGRVEKVIGPNDSINYPAAIYEYDLSVSNPLIDPVKVIKKVKAKDNPSTFDFPDYYSSYSFYDGIGRLIEAKSPAESNPGTGAQRQIISGLAQYNNRGLVQRKYLSYFVDSSPNFIAPDYNQPYASFQYDCLGRAIQATNPDNTHSSTSYDDWQVTAIDENNHYKTYYYDAYQRLIKVEEHNSSLTYITTYEYDISGNLIKVTDNQNNITTITYDSLSRKIRMIDPDMGTWNYEYDNVGNLVKQIDAAGQELTFTYDSINRLTQKNIQATQSVNYEYDDPAKIYCIGRLSKVTYEAGSAEFFYDNLGREIKSIKIVDGLDYTVQRTYDSLDRLITLTYPDGETITYTYNPQGIETVRSVSDADSYTKLLLHNDGQGGSTNFIDSSVSANTVTANGAQMDTAQKKFGTASGLFDGSGDHLSLADSDDWDFGSGDFTIDFWIRFDGFPPQDSADTFLSQRQDATHFWNFYLLEFSGQYKLSLNTQNGGSEATYSSSAITLSTNTWYHIAFVRSSGTMYWFVNGTQYSSAAVTDNLTITGDVLIGCYKTDAYFIDGWIDEFRVSKGIARWTADFTPPADSYSTGIKDYVTNVNYSPTGQILKIEYGNGTFTQYTYDPNTLRLSQLKTYDLQLITIQNLQYSFDNVGNILGITDNINTGTQTFQYDDLSRLTYANGASYGQINYSYDSIGNILTKGNLSLNYNNTRPHAVSSYTNSQTGQTVNFSYDANGNLINRLNGQTGEQTNYFYDYESHLTKTEQIYPQASAMQVTLQFQQGWNFFSLPVIPQNPLISEIFSGKQIGTDYDQVSRYEPATGEFQHYVGDPAFNEFDTLEYGKGYIIYVNNPAGLNVTVTGTTPSPQNISLAAGWNLIPYPYLSQRSTQQALGNLQFGVDYDLVLSYNQITGEFQQYPGSFCFR